MHEPDTSPIPTLPPRDPGAHKGTGGTVLIVGGSTGGQGTLRMLGAPALAGRAAIRSGAGLVRIAAPEPVLNDLLSDLNEATGVALPCDQDGALLAHESARAIDPQLGAASCLVVGPGLGQSDGVRALVLRCVGQEGTPVVLDADGLNALASLVDYPKEIRASCVLTPHPGEYRRLAEPLGISLDPTDETQRPEACAELARRLGVVVVLKGKGSVVSDGLRAWVCTRGSPALATGGTGDVLSGVLGGLIAQYVAPGPAAIGGVTMPRPPERPLDLYDAARVAVEAHAIAGERWGTAHGASAGLLASELADGVPGVLEGMRPG